MHISEQYTRGLVRGWDEELARDQFKFFATSFYNINAKNYQTKDKFMLYEIVRKVLGKDTLNYGQAVGDPFASGTKVLMSDESEKNVEDVKIGDVVLNHRREKAKVANVIKKKFTGDLVTVKLKNWNRTVTATESHHGMTYEERPEFKYDRGDRTKFGQMKVGDYILLPFAPDIIVLPGDKVVYTQDNVAYGVARQIESIDRQEVKDYYVYCITTENEYTAVFNGMAHYQCVGFAAKNATEYLECAEIILGNQQEKFRSIHPSFYYGTSRVQVGQGRLGGGDGSSGSWMAEAVMKYGALALDEPGVPQYSGQISRKWGNRPGPDQKYLDFGQKHLIKSAAVIRSWEEGCAAISAGYPIHICSNQGFKMEPNSSGFHEASGNWSHALAWLGYDNKHPEPYGLILNSWGCFDKETEVLTDRGWKKFQDLDKTEKICTLNPSSWYIEYQTPTNYFEYDFNGYLYNFMGRDFNLMVTDNHNLYACKHHKNKRDIRNWEKIEAKDVAKHFYMKKDGHWEGEEVKTYKVGEYEIDMDLWLEFLGYFLSEGYTTSSKRIKKRILANGEISTAKWGRSYRVGVCQRKVDILEKIIRCCKKLPFTCRVDGNGVQFSNKTLYTELAVYGKAYQKYLPEYAKNLSKRQLTILFKALMDGDGCYSECPTGWKVTYYTSSKRLADDFQELCLKIGYAADISSTNRIGRYASNGTTRHIEYRVGIKQINVMQKIKHRAILLPYNDKIYCLEVPNHLMYVRRNGKACWCGNSVHGQLKDFDTGDPWPVGVLRVRRRVIESMIRSGQECFAYSQFEGFPDNSERLEKELFDFIDNNWYW